MIKPWVDIGCLIVREVPLDEYCKNSNVALQNKKTWPYFDGWFARAEESGDHDQNHLSAVHHKNLPVEGIVIESNVEDPIEPEVVHLIQMTLLTFNPQKDNQGEEDCPNNDES